MAIMEGQTKYIDRILEDFDHVTRKPDNFLDADETLSKKIKSSLKETYDYSKSEEKDVNKSSALPELIIKSFDLEQIWQQIELQNESLLSQSITNVSKLIVGKNGLIFDDIQKEVENTKFLEEKRDNIVKDHADNMVDKENLNENSSSESESDNDDFELNEDDEVSNEETADTKSFNTSKNKSVVDDEFFKLEEMEKFLIGEEKRIENEDVQSDSEESDSEPENNIDLFKGDLDNEDDDEKIKSARFKDFFVAKDSNKKTKQNKFLESMSDDDNEIKSSLELRQDRLKKKIHELEQTAISDKPWQLKGEIKAEDRPQNSLLEEIVEFDLTSRPAPIITEKTTLQLEDIIRQRIKDRVFDSVERKVKPVETPLEYKKKLVLDQEKSKQSLAQIYEKEFLEQQAALNPENADKEEEEPELHKEIKSLMKNLFNKLDALSNYHFTPKPSIPELKVVNNLPAITMEEVAPNAASDAALLAPEEVKNKTKGEIIAKSERTATDKNRERRKKKLKQRAHLKEKQKHENTINKLNPGLGNKYSKEKAKKMLQKVTRESNTEMMDEHTDSKAVKSSKAFFTRLQEEVHSQISSKVQNKKSKKKDQFIAKKIKL